ncbi:MAG: GNAT family N-acetyltransferase [Phycisphaeraceae bacterium]|nr:GNAT family N-acetyltransferase [Phycisphaeraceae bacterium]
MSFSLRVDDRISLRLVELHHAQELYDQIDRNREHLRPWFRWAPHVKDVEEVRREISDWLTLFARTGCFRTFIDVDGKSAGLVFYQNPEVPSRLVEIGFWLDAGCEGKGVMTKSAGFLMDYAFAELAMRRVQMKADVTNTRSRAVIERLGLTFEGVIRSAYRMPDGRYVDAAMYSMLDDQWKERQR